MRTQQERMASLRLTRVVPVLTAIILALGLISLLIAACLPVYTDELLWRMSNGRLNLDGGENVNAYLTCGVLAFPVPVVLLPFRWLDTLLYSGVENPLILRAAGCALAVGLIGVALLIARRLGGLKGRIAVLLILSTAAIGVMPLLLVINRPEQPLLLGLIVFALPLVLGIPRGRTSWSGDLLLALALAGPGCVIMASHPRSILLLPLAAMCVLRYVNRRIVAAPVIAVLAIDSLATVHNMGVRTMCNDPNLAPILLQDSLLAALGTGQIGHYLLALLANAIVFTGNVFYISEFQFRPDYRSYILPGTHSVIADLLGYITEAIFAALLIVGAYAFTLRLRRAIRDSAGRIQTAALFWLWFFYGFSVVARVYKNDYEAAVLMPVIALMTIGSVWAARDDFHLAKVARWEKAWPAAVLGFAGLAIVSQITLIAVYAPHAVGDWRRPGYPPEQRFSVSAFGYGAVRSEILQAGAKCGILPDSGARHLVLDELTYYAYRRSYQPFLATFIDQHGWGRGIKDFRAVLANVGSQGMVVGCQWVPDSLRGFAQRDGDFCCVAPTAWR